MRREKSQVCPRCNENLLKSQIGHNAISQEDGMTFICSSCGVNESRMKWFKAKRISGRIPKEQLQMTEKFRNKLGLEIKR
jgi:DNA-directed RNA polymerase subunit M/transcription elongation factor TFIIS